LSSSIVLETETILALVAKIVQARRLYGADSAYVIGLVTGVDALLEAVDGGTRWRDMVHARILEAEGGKAGRPPAEAPSTSPATPPQPAAETLAENTWIKGIVKWFNNDKGYGFISTDSHIDVFVHWRDISSWDRSLAQGDEVEFMVTRTAKGFQAVNVMKGGQEAETRQTPTPEARQAEGAEARQNAGPEARPAAGGTEESSSASEHSSSGDDSEQAEGQAAQESDRTAGGASAGS